MQARKAGAQAGAISEARANRQVSDGIKRQAPGQMPLMEYEEDGCRPGAAGGNPVPLCYVY